MIAEYALVRLRRPVAAIPVRIGTEGTVVLVFNSVPAAYEVEFFDAEGSSLGTFTVEEADLEEIKS